jgi:peptide/nickel transport system substrate-binding protein
MNRSIRASVLIGQALCAFSVWLSLAAVAQTPPTKLPAEEEDPNRPAKPHVHLQLPDEKAASRPAEAERLPEMVRAVDESKSAALRAFFQELSVPHDVVTWKDGRHQFVEPLSTYVANPPDPSATVNMHFYDEQWHARPMHPELLREVQRVDHFESIALARVAKLLEQPAAGPGTESKLSSVERQEAAEKALSAVLSFHKAARVSGRRDGNGWNDLENQLRQKLGSLQMLALYRLVDADDWSRAIELAGRLSQGYATDAKMQSDIGTALGQLVAHAADRHDYAQVQLRTKTLKDRFPDTVANISIRLHREADDFMKKAKDAQARGEIENAIQTARLAENIDPLTPGLKDLQLQLRGNVPKTLGVGVRDVPELLSPTAAVTDSEKQALDLLFESLVRVRERPGIGQVFEPVLAATPPEVIRLGRRFQLATDAYWSDGKPVSAADVRATVESRLRRAVDPMWTELMDTPLPSQEPFVIGLHLKQGQLEPLSIMTFKVLPASRTLVADDSTFASNPMGSGPFQLLRRDENTAVFQANPYYNRTSQGGIPNIRQIQFFHSVNPPSDFQNGRLHLLLDLSTRDTQPLESLGDVKVWTLRNRRIYFLAVNSRRKFATVDVRRTIAHAINREQILQDVFRLSGREGPHRVLNGPFPPDCWAAEPRLAGDLYNVATAKMVAGRVQEPIRVGLKFPVELKFPNDESTRQACEKIRDQVRLIQPNIDIELLPRSVRQLHEEVENTNDFELAYYYYDFPDDLYSLWPLLNPKSYLGYYPGFQAELQKVFTHRDPASIREAMHRLDDRVHDEMPLIPLWQLDTHVAIHNDLKIDPPEGLDPAQIFADVARWHLGDKQ